MEVDSKKITSENEVPKPKRMGYVCPDCKFCIDGDTDCELKHDVCDGTGCGDYEPYDDEIK